MIYAILDRLKNNTTKDGQSIPNLLGATANDSKIYPLNANINSIPCISYTDVPVSDDGLLKVNRLEVRAIDNDYDHLQEVVKTVSDILIIQENKPGYIFQDVNIMSCSQNGGGAIEDIQNNIYEKFIYLQIEWRYLNEQ